jgi:hypothetical protein
VEHSSRSTFLGNSLNWLLPVAYAAVVVLVGAFGSGEATGIVAAVGGVLLGCYYAFGRRAAKGARSGDA